MIFGILGTKRTVRNREVSVRRGWTVFIFLMSFEFLSIYLYININIDSILHGFSLLIS